MPKTRKSSPIELKIMNFVSTRSQDDQFTQTDLATVAGTDYKNVWRLIQTLLAEEKIHISAKVPAKGGVIMYSKGYKVVRPMLIPLSAQSELWNTMFYICAPPPPAETTYAQLFHGINRWCDIVVEIWAARNADSWAPSMPSSLGSSSSLMYATSRGGVRGD